MQAKVGLHSNVADKGDVVRVFIKDRQLQMGNAGEDGIRPVKAITENQFRISTAPDEMTFPPAKPGEPQRLAIKHGGGKTETFSATPAFTPTPAQLAEYAGVYVSPEIDPLYEFKWSACTYRAPFPRSRIGLSLCCSDSKGDRMCFSPSRAISLRRRAKYSAP